MEAEWEKNNDETVWGGEVWETHAGCWVAWCCLCDGSDGSASILLERDATCDGVSLLGVATRKKRGRRRGGGVVVVRTNSSEDSNS